MTIIVFEDFDIYVKLSEITTPNSSYFHSWTSFGPILQLVISWTNFGSDVALGNIR